jgi:hypothetical protein
MIHYELSKKHMQKTTHRRINRNNAARNRSLDGQSATSVESSHRLPARRQAGTFSIAFMLSDLVIACLPQAGTLHPYIKKGDPDFRRDRPFHNHC